MSFLLKPTQSNFLGALLLFLAVTLLPFQGNLSTPVKGLCLMVFLSSFFRKIIGQKLFSIIRVILLIVGVRFAFIRSTEVNELTLMIPIQLLAVLLCLKATEMDSRRDVSLLLLIGTLFLLFNMLLEESFWYLIFILFYLSSIFSLDLESSHQNSLVFFFQRWKKMLTTSFFLVPMAFILFLIFPRIPVPGIVNWSAMNVGKSGLSQELSPGSIESLMLDERVAFRFEAEASNELNPQSHYFYADYLYETQGLSWQRGSALFNQLRSKSKVGDMKTYNFKITLEQMREKRLPVPKETLAISSNRYLQVREVRSGLYEAAFLNSNYYSYNGNALISANSRPEMLSDRQMQNLTKTNFYQSEQIKELVSALKIQLLSRSISEVFDSYFQQHGFVYSLDPGTLNSNDKLTEFLFLRKKGFCEHYAASTASLLRLLGVPARIAIGFLGGDYNQYAGTLSVRYMDAHSWVEYWDARSKTWILYDPVARLAPDRLTFGSDSFLLQEGRSESTFSLRTLRRQLEWLDKGIKLFQTGQLSLGSFMQGFDRDRQRDFYRNTFDFKVYQKILQKIKSRVLPTFKFIPLAGAAILGLIILGIIGLTYAYYRKRYSLSGTWHFLLVKTLSRLGRVLPGLNKIPPGKLIEFIGSQVPAELHQDWLNLGKNYLEMSYGSGPSEVGKLKIAQFNEKVKAFLHKLENSNQS